METFWGSFLEILSWPYIAYLAGGVGIGLVFGIMPGLGGITGLSLLLPLTYTIDFRYAIVVMTAMLAVTVTSDTIPTILIGIPPTAGASATLLDGHPLALKGEAARALGASYTSSIIGGLLGALALWATIPVLRPVVLAFGPPEIFMLALWGLSMLGALSSGSLLKGLSAAFIGVLLGTIGRSPSTGYYRYSFDIPYLIEGLNIMPVTLGLFAIPEIVQLAVEKGTIARSGLRGNLLQGQLQGMRDALRNWFLILRASLIGVWIGIVPGVGPATADWIAYSHAVKTCKGRENFGKGDIRGVIAPEASNNAVRGGDLIPTIAFGVPGSAPMAILLGAFFIAGIHPGPSMLGSNIGITYKIIWSLALANVIGGGICIIFTSQIAKIAYLPSHYLISLITPFLILAAFMGTTNPIDILVMILFGLLGFGMKHCGWPRAPMIVGFVLSDIAEWNFVISVTLMGVSWLFRPIVIGIVLLFVVDQAFTYFTTRKAKAQATSSVSSKIDERSSIKK